MTSHASQTLDAERELVGTLLVFYSPRLIHVAQAAGLTPQDFYRVPHAVIYKAILRLHAREDHVDTLTVTRFLLEQPHPDSETWLDHIGGPAQVEFIACFSEVNGFKERCRIVHEDAQARRSIRAAQEALQAADSRDWEAYWEAWQRMEPGWLRKRFESKLRVIEGGKAA